MLFDKFVSFMRFLLSNSIGLVDKTEDSIDRTIVFVYK